ncbi:hypothetical protein P4O66_000215 [Electrophorus voltai]|uniref:Uncharacterized protein n=1 Tax=Electrophorus voltai TaxID=2609070 RepID=A0AAD8ZJY9_9TELE|nr:hypothetical protein P4O66_000215 [Electrophorus voltai]
MNLYRSFGCLLETWVAEGYPAAAFLGGGSESRLDTNGSYSTSTDTVRFPGITLRSESEDSGVELPSVASAQTPLSSTPIQTTEDTPPSSSSLGPSRCSSSLSWLSRGAEGYVESTTAEGGPVEQALDRAKPAWRQDTRKSSPEPGVDDGTRRRAHTVSSFRVCHCAGEAYQQPTHQQGLAENHQRTHTAQPHALSTTDLAEQAEGNTETGLSPGLLYLEQVCRVMQEMARVQKMNRRLQAEVETLRDCRRETERKSACSQQGAINCADGERPELWGLEEPPDFLSHAFRRRTVSDTRAFLQQQNRAKSSKGGQFMSTDVLLEEPENIRPEEGDKVSLAFPC